MSRKILSVQYTCSACHKEAVKSDDKPMQLPDGWIDVRYDRFRQQSSDTHVCSEACRETWQAKQREVSVVNVEMATDGIIPQGAKRVRITKQGAAKLTLQDPYYIGQEMVITAEPPGYHEVHYLTGFNDEPLYQTIHSTGFGTLTLVDEGGTWHVDVARSPGIYLGWLADKLAATSERGGE